MTRYKPVDRRKTPKEKWRERVREKRRKDRARQMREQKEREAAAMKEVDVKQLELDRGGDGERAVTHGMYRASLNSVEAEMARRVHAHLKTAYPNLDDSVDQLDLVLAVKHYVKAMRRPKKKYLGDPKVEKIQGYHARIYRDFIDSLGLHRKQRTEEAQTKEVARALQALFPRVPDPMTLERDANGTWVPTDDDKENEKDE